jgi:hypothetical protein
MARIHRSEFPRTDDFNVMANAAAAKGDTNDCAVKAVAIACGVEYDAAHAVLKEHGRREGQGTPLHMIAGACGRFGFRMTALTYLETRAKRDLYPGVHKNLQSITTHHPDRFPQAWKDGQTYMFLTPKHILTVKDGVNHDWTRGKALRVVTVYRIEKA